MISFSDRITSGMEIIKKICKILINEIINIQVIGMDENIYNAPSNSELEIATRSVNSIEINFH